MTEKEQATQLRNIAEAPSLTIEGRQELHRVADELDPPKPEPGTVVWCRTPQEDWFIGITTEKGVKPIDNLSVTYTWSYKDIEWKPARIIAPDEVAVKIPPLSEWPDDIGSIAQRMIPMAERTRFTIITRAEAEEIG